MSDWLPKICRHLTPEIVNYTDDKLALVVRLKGIPFEGVDDNQSYAQFKQYKTLLAALGKSSGSNFAIWTTVKRRRTYIPKDYQFKDKFAQQFADAYTDKFNKSKYFKNSFYITAVLKYSELEDGLNEMKEIKQSLVNGLAAYEPVVLSCYQNENGVIFSEVFEFIGELINGEKEPALVTTEPAYKSIPTADIHFGSRSHEIRTNSGRQKFFVAYDLRDLGQSQAKILLNVLTVPCEFTFTQSFQYLGNYEVIGRIDKQLNNLRSVGDQAEEQQKELEKAKGSLTSGTLKFGEYSGSLIVYGDSDDEAYDNGSLLSTVFLNNGGFRFIKSGLSSPITYFAQVPNVKHKARVSLKSTDNLACTFGMQNFSQGKWFGNPLKGGTAVAGSAVIPLETMSKTLYGFSFHHSNEKEDNIGDKIAGHTLLLGATGTGKTTTQTALLTFLARFDPYIFALDLDRGMEIWVRALGGDYFSIQQGVPTGLNPFQLPDTPENREFLYSLVAVCGQRDNNMPVSAKEESYIKTAVDTLMEMSVEKRNFSTLLENITHDPDENSLENRLAKWCRDTNGRFAWCLDNPSNEFDAETFYRIGIDLTDILIEGYTPCIPVLMYLFRLKEILMQKVKEKDGILVTIFEEFWKSLKHPVTAEFLVKILKTDRKLGGFAVLVTQSPEDAINSEYFSTIVQQTPTKLLLPNPDAQWEGYSKIGITRKQFDDLVQKPLECREFLIKQSKQVSFAKLNLYGMWKEIAVLSGSSANLVRMEKAIAQVGKNPDDWLPVYWKMIEES